MTALGEACADLAAWLPHAAQLITQPDTQPVDGRAQPESQPPWNAAVANVLLDVHEFSRRAEATERLIINGHTGRRRGGSDANTIAALEAAAKLSYGLPACPPPCYDTRNNLLPCPCAGCVIRRRLSQFITAVMALAAIDLAERIRKIPKACPYCKSGELRIVVSVTGLEEGKVACLNLACADTNGEHPRGVIAWSQLDAEWHLYWNDGAVT